MIEKEINKYVIVDADTGDYLKAEMRTKTYEFVEDIEIATKTYDSMTAQIVINRYNLDNQVDENNLIAMPIKITYELLEGEAYQEATELDMMNMYCNMLASANSNEVKEIEFSNGTKGYVSLD